MSDSDWQPYRVDSSAEPAGRQPQAHGCAAILLVPFLLVLSGFATFGFLHSGELPGPEALPWRIVYGLGVVCSMSACCWLFWRVIRSR